MRLRLTSRTRSSRGRNGIFGYDQVQRSRIELTSKNHDTCKLSDCCCYRLQTSYFCSQIHSALTLDANDYIVSLRSEKPKPLSCVLPRIDHSHNSSIVTHQTRNNALISNHRNHPRLFCVITILLFLCIQCYIHPSESSSLDHLQSPANSNKTGQFFIEQLCPRGSNIPATRRIEGASLESVYSDVDMNCTITFRTKTAHQHFIIQFEDLKLGCSDHLRLFDQDGDYGQSPIHDYSCRDNMASARDIRTYGTFLTIRFITDSISQPGDGFRIVVTAVFDHSECPPDYAQCRDHYCISRTLFCDGIHHCLDGTDETVGCDSPNSDDLPYALGLLVALVLAISLCVVIFIASIYCRRDSPYTQYQHQLQQTMGVPLQASSSIMFPNHQTPHQLPIIVLYHNEPGNL